MKKELIKFLNEVYEDHTANGSHRIKARQLLELINSNEPNEFQAIGNNEGKESICPKCKGLGEYFIRSARSFRPCEKCKGTGQI